MRQSIAALALITRPCDEGTEWLLLWNSAWRALSLIGGHKRPGESFRDCFAREVAEELGLTPGTDFAVVPDRVGDRLEYEAISGRSGELTAYQIELFPVELLTEAARQRVATNPDHAWVCEAEIGRHRAYDGRSISASVEDQLRRADVL